MKSFNFKHCLLVIIFIISSASAISRTNSSLFNNNHDNLKNSAKVMEPRGHESWGYLDSYGGGGDVGAYGKSEYYWLIPLVIVIGFGALLLPLLGTLMTTMITQGTINLTAGRRKRDVYNSGSRMSDKGVSEYIVGLLAKVEESLDKFGNQLKNDVSPLISKFASKKL